MKTLRLDHLLTYSEVIDRINHSHADFPGSHWYALEKSKQYSGNDWYEATIPSELIASLTIHEPHQHDNGKTILIQEGETIQQAAAAYQALADSGNLADKECYQKIEAIREIVRSGHDIDPLILVYNRQTNELTHIDGLHRMVAWMIEASRDELKGLVAVQ